MSIYLKNGYVDIEKILSYGLTFNFLVGGRGTGKTFGTLKHVIESGKRIMLMRRTQAQCDLINKPEFNPFKAVCEEYDYSVWVKPVSKYSSGMYKMNGEEIERLIGYTCALSTIANMRGFDASDVELLVYDEFIPERHEKKGKFEGASFLNAYETINRNRELKGDKPLQVLGLANAFDLGNAIFLELGLVGVCEKMVANGQELYINRDKGLLVCILKESEISEQKRETALYKLAKGGYSDMALSNEFAYNDDTNVGSTSLKEYKLFCSVQEIHIYKHKSRKEFYISEHRTGTADSFKSDEVDLLRYRKKYGLRLYSSYMRNNIFFENMLTKTLFELYTI